MCSAELCGADEQLSEHERVKGECWRGLMDTQEEMKDITQRVEQINAQLEKSRLQVSIRPSIRYGA